MHNAHAEEGGISALVRFDPGSSDVFTVSFKRGGGQGGAKPCSRPVELKFSSTMLRVAINVTMHLETQKLSLRNISAQGAQTQPLSPRNMSARGRSQGPARGLTSDPGSLAAASGCLRTETNLGFDTSAGIIEGLIASSGLGAGEPLFRLSWLDPRANHSITPPTITCPTHTRLTWPFVLPTSKPDPNADPSKQLDVLEVQLPSRAATRASWRDAVAAHGLGSTSCVETKGDGLGMGLAGEYVRATDVHRVSTVEASGPGVVADVGTHQLRSDFRGNVTFTATNLFGLTNSCTVLVSTFTTSTAWSSATMDVSGRRDVAPAANGSCTDRDRRVDDGTEAGRGNEGMENEGGAGGGAGGGAERAGAGGGAGARAGGVSDDGASGDAEGARELDRDDGGRERGGTDGDGNGGGDGGADGNGQPPTPVKPASITLGAAATMTAEAEATHGQEGGEGAPVYFVNSTYTIPGPKEQLCFGKAKLFDNFVGDESEIVFQISVAPRVDGLVYIDQQSGDVIVSPSARHLPPGRHTQRHFNVTLRGRDAAGAEAVVQRWGFTVRRRPKFEVLGYRWGMVDLPGTASEGAGEGAGGGAGEGAASPGGGPGDEREGEAVASRAGRPFAVGEAFHFAPVTLTSVANETDAAKCTFTLHYEGKAARGVFINPTSGEIQGLVRTEETYNVSLIAIDEHGASFKLDTVELDFRHRDVTNPANGPGGAGCVRGQGTAVDLPSLDDLDDLDPAGAAGLGLAGAAGAAGAVGRNASTTRTDPDEFDGVFTCECDAGFRGPNCAEQHATSQQPGSGGGGDSGLVVAAVLLPIIVILCLIAASYKVQAYRKARAPADFTAQLKLLLNAGELRADELADELARIGTPREMPRGWLTMVERLGSGNFGEVWKALLHDKDNRDVPEYLVAAKTVLPTGGHVDQGHADLVQEATVMARVGHHDNLVALVGVVTRGDPWVVVVSFCEHGDIAAVLQVAAANGEPWEGALKLRMCREIASGMGHLASCRVVHRDLAARNVLLASSHVCKVADFGLSRYVAETEAQATYYRSTNGCFPVKWTAPEAIEASKFSAASDVWSFGITCVEVFQDGATPYPGLSNPAVLAMVVASGGHRTHHRPLGCPPHVFAVVASCWAPSPDDRPTFCELETAFVQLHDAETKAWEASEASEGGQPSAVMPRGSTWSGSSLASSPNSRSSLAPPAWGALQASGSSLEDADRYAYSGQDDARVAPARLSAWNPPAKPADAAPPSVAAGLSNCEFQDVLGQLEGYARPGDRSRVAGNGHVFQPGGAARHTVWMNAGGLDPRRAGGRGGEYTVPESKETPHMYTVPESREPREPRVAAHTHTGPGARDGRYGTPILLGRDRHATTPKPEHEHIR